MCAAAYSRSVFYISHVFIFEYFRQIYIITVILIKRAVKRSISVLVVEAAARSLQKAASFTAAPGLIFRSPLWFFMME